MFSPKRASMVLAGLMSVAIFIEAAEAAEQDLPSAATVDALEDWLDANTPYPRRASVPRILIVDRPAAVPDLQPARTVGVRPRGYYAPGRETIYLIRPWSAEDPHDLSVLVHELAHHRLATARHWYCPGAQEEPAYRAQAAWLDEFGLTARINWIAVMLESGCTRRDIHPD